MSKYVLAVALLCAAPARAELVVHTSELKDAAIADPGADNLAYVPKEPAAGPRLLVFLAGSGAKIDGYRNFLQAAADRGFYVIGLAYRNDHSHTALCGCMAACMGPMEEQSATGADNGFYAGDAANGLTPRANSVDHRLARLLTVLQDRKVDGKAFDWSKFLDASGRPAWSKIVVAGHSGGGNLATWMLKAMKPRGAIAFSAPSPNLDVAQPTDAKLTPWTAHGKHGTCMKNKGLPDWVTRGFGDHLLVYDDVRDHAYTTAWAGHDIPGVVKKLGLTEVKFHDGENPSGRWISRVTESTACPGDNPHHAEPIADCAVDAAGKPLHHGVWHYLLGVALSF